MMITAWSINIPSYCKLETFLFSQRFWAAKVTAQMLKFNVILTINAKNSFFALIMRITVK